MSSMSMSHASRTVGWRCDTPTASQAALALKQAPGAVATTRSPPGTSVFVATAEPALPVVRLPAPRLGDHPRRARGLRLRDEDSRGDHDRARSARVLYINW